ncbi:MAG: 2-hydroxyacyl-CoA dehydratase family protein, partial [Candidatus Bathyarchaeota archaeon]
SERKLETLKGFYQDYVKPFYKMAHKAKDEGKLVAWVASTFPVEILLAMDIVPVWPENYASLCAARKTSVPLCELAERKGFSKDICSYARCVLGSLFDGKDLPEGGIPHPDILVASTCACDTHLKWFQVASRIFKKPLLLLDVPYNIEGTSPENLESYHIQYYVNQLEDLVECLEKYSGTLLGRANLRKTMEFSRKTNELWLKIQEQRKTIPTPMGAREAFSAVYFILCVPGTEQAVEFYKMLYSELDQRVKQGIGITEDERYRLVWDNLPPWFDLKFFHYLRSLGAVVVAETFSHVWAGPLDVLKPYESLARKHLSNMSNCSISRRTKLISDLVRDFSANGFILPTNWGCKMMTIGETIVKQEVHKMTGVTGLILDVDSTDWRHYDEYRVKTKLETYLRTLDD